MKDFARRDYADSNRNPPKSSKGIKDSTKTKSKYSQPYRASDDVNKYYPSQTNRRSKTINSEAPITKENPRVSKSHRDFAVTNEAYIKDSKTNFQDSPKATIADSANTIHRDYIKTKFKGTHRKTYRDYASIKFSKRSPSTSSRYTRSQNTYNNDDRITASWIEIQLLDKPKGNKTSQSNGRTLILATAQMLDERQQQTKASKTGSPETSTRTVAEESLYFIQKAAIRTKLLAKKLHEQFGSSGPVIVTGDFGWETNTPCYAIMKSFAFKNTMEKSRFIYTDFTSPSKTLTDYIWHTTNLESVLSAVMIDVRPDGRVLSNHRPVLGIMKLK